MLEFWKDGKKVGCEAIYGRGHVGQVVVLDHVSFGDNPNLEKYPLARYPQPYAFTIVEKVEGKDGYYVVMDGDGSRIVLCDQYYGASEAYLYDANEWLAWQKEHAREKLARKERKIEQLEGHLALLKEILTKQGIRLVSEETAKKLGIGSCLTITGPGGILEQTPKG